MFNKFNKKKKFSKEDESALLNDILNDNLEDDIEEDYEKDIDDTDDEIGLINDILNEEENEESNDDNEDLHSVNNKKKKEKSDSEYYKEEYLKDKKNDKKKNDEDDDSNEELEVLNINDIENIAGKRKRISSKKSKNNKMYLLLIGIVVIVVGVLIAMMLLPGNENTEVVDPSIKIEDTSNLVQDIVIEEKKSEITQYGEVKRILSNKIIIIPDNSESDTIYFINDKTKVDVNTFLEIGDRIEYTYIIEDQNYIFINFKDIYSGIVNQKYDGKLIIQLDNKDYSIIDTLEKDDKEETENVDNAENSESLEDNNTENEELKEEIISVIGDEFSYGISLKTIAEQIENGDKIEFCLDDNNNITSISNIIKKNKDNNYESTPKYAKREKVDIITNEFNKDDFSNEYSVIEKNEGIDHFEFIKETDFVNNSVKFYNSFEDPIWIRFAWRDSSLLKTDEIENNVFEKMPSVNDVTISFITPSGKTISSENIEKENIGRMWLDGNIVNFAIRNPEPGEWTLKADKNSGFYLGETNFHLMKLTGFITIEKFGINNLDNGLVEFIWNVGGVEDEFMEIEISLVGEKYSKSIYKASSKTSNLRNVDHCILDLSEIPKGTYSVIAKVKDLDIITHKDDPENVSEHTRQVSAETIVHRKTVGQLEIN